MITIAASLLSADMGRLADEVRTVEAAGADWIHFDVMDGHFVPNLTFGAPVLRCLRAVTTLPFDAHLMVEDPERFLDAFAEAGATGVTVHAEACPRLPQVLADIRARKMRAGVSVKPATSLSVLEHVLEAVDLILIMSVNPGFGGQAFMPSVLPKLREARELITRSGRPIDLEVDGGIHPDIAPLVIEAGANVLVAGSAIFRSVNYREAIAALRGRAA